MKSLILITLIAPLLFAFTYKPKSMNSSQITFLDRLDGRRYKHRDDSGFCDNFFRKIDAYRIRIEHYRTKPNQNCPVMPLIYTVKSESTCSGNQCEFFLESDKSYTLKLEFQQFESIMSLFYRTFPDGSGQFLDGSYWILKN